ncbi:MAG: hypothetical protein AB1Z98_01815 [Nannocystaceae bacterium]
MSDVVLVGDADAAVEPLPGSECTTWFQEGDGPPEACAVAEPGVCALPQ